MFGDIISSILGITVFPIVITVVFLMIFIGIIIWAIRADKSYIKKMSELPLDSTMKNGE